MIAVAVRTRAEFLSAARELGITPDMRGIGRDKYEARRAARERYNRVACAILRARSQLAWEARQQ